ncbi:helix-turn-helix domain-containing protein [Streptomyces sp. URMC 123]|uniref:helix-turn-helix domain-containing protein n=1 Tax=Streptomyces sp. URMC 123 TaxID=3423403 RepID=UPI003F1D5ABD
MGARPCELTPDRSARHYYGAEMRRLRNGAGMSLAGLGDIVGYSKQHLASIEKAERMIPPDLSAMLDAAFGTDGHFVRLFQLARREVHPDQYRRYMDFEAQAVVIEHYATHVIPGLLQTEAYARAFFAYAPDGTPEVIADRMAARMARKERLLSADRPHLWVILDEAVLRRPVGEPEVMREQLEALVPLTDTRTTKVQVLPFSHGGHALMEGPLSLLRLSDGTCMVYEEGRDTGRLYETAQEVEWRRGVYDALRAYACSPKQSAEFITEIMEGYASCPAT